MDDARRLVVGAALLRAGRVLAARRTAPPEAAGRWELPGGKVEPGERPEDALARELSEELGCTAYVVGWLPGRSDLGGGLELAVALAELADPAVEPVATEHDRLRWLAPDELDDVDWLDGDRPFLPALRGELLARRAPGDPDPAGLPRRGVLLDLDDAREVADRLERAGHRAVVERAPLAGEDDDEDQPWAVLTDAPADDLDRLLAEHDGWVETVAGPAPDAPAGAPVPLPSAPRRRLG